MLNKDITEGTPGYKNTVAGFGEHQQGGLNLADVASSLEDIGNSNNNNRNKKDKTTTIAVIAIVFQFVALVFLTGQFYERQREVDYQITKLLEVSNQMYTDIAVLKADQIEQSRRMERFENIVNQENKYNYNHR